jgi:hypothetical protein
MVRGRACVAPIAFVPSAEGGESGLGPPRPPVRPHSGSLMLSARADSSAVDLTQSSVDCRRTTHSAQPDGASARADE